MEEIVLKLFCVSNGKGWPGFVLVWLGFCLFVCFFLIGSEDFEASILFIFLCKEKGIEYIHELKGNLKYKVTEQLTRWDSITTPDTSLSWIICPSQDKSDLGGD